MVAQWALAVPARAGHADHGWGGWAQRCARAAGRFRTAAGGQGRSLATGGRVAARAGARGRRRALADRAPGCAWQAHVAARGPALDPRPGAGCARPDRRIGALRGRPRRAASRRCGWPVARGAAPAADAAHRPAGDAGRWQPAAGRQSRQWRRRQLPPRAAPGRGRPAADAAPGSARRGRPRRRGARSAHAIAGGGELSQHGRRHPWHRQRAGNGGRHRAQVPGPRPWPAGGQRPRRALAGQRTRGHVARSAAAPVRPAQRQPAADPGRARHRHEVTAGSRAGAQARDRLHRFRRHARARVRAAAAGRGRRARTAGYAGARRSDQPFPRRVRWHRAVPGQSRLRGVPVEFPRLNRPRTRLRVCPEGRLRQRPRAAGHRRRRALAAGARHRRCEARRHRRPFVRRLFRVAGADIPAGPVQGRRGRRAAGGPGLVDALAGPLRFPGRPAGPFAAAHPARAVAGQHRLRHPCAPACAVAAGECGEDAPAAADHRRRRGPHGGDPRSGELQRYPEGIGASADLAGGAERRPFAGRSGPARGLPVRDGNHAAAPSWRACTGTTGQRLRAYLRANLRLAGPEFTTFAAPPR